MVLESLQLNTALGNFSLLDATFSLFPLTVFALSMIIYCVFIYKLYKLVSTKDIIRISMGGGHKTLHRIAYGLEYIFLFPIVSFVWFFVMAVILASFSTASSIGTVFMMSMATLATIRVTAYYEEELAQDIAKLVPLALLAVFLTELSISQPNSIFLVINELQLFRETLVYYFLFIVGLELILRLFSELDWKQKTGERINFRPRA